MQNIFSSAVGMSYAQILTLTIPELSALLPGMENFRKCREIMDLIRQHVEVRLVWGPTLPRRVCSPRVSELCLLQ